ncbi:MAG: hypothetical protein IPK64_16825 [bacterium]|nr:hypothetical protein [bacterium]
MMRLYGWLMAAVGACILIEVWLFRSGKAESVALLFWYLLRLLNSRR